jgi:hypothetical protein
MLLLLLLLQVQWAHAWQHELVAAGSAGRQQQRLSWPAG